MQLHDILHHFEVTAIQPVPEEGSELISMRHAPTGARLYWMRNSEKNKLFSIAFKTIPWDDTGVFHILEHSVLGGSKRYPVKEPFLELLKSSLNTFLNAMTFPDKTVYPVSSRNDTDFMNLTRVYLDAVFDPAIYFNPNIFRQEGWHVECRSPEDEPVYKGVVFNEMKGALSDVDSRAALELQRMLYPDSCYGFESGGDPVSIPNLTYERFLEAHRTFYHPSNAIIYLDGDLNLDAVLALVDGEYLSRYTASDAVHEIPWQQPVPFQRRERVYPVAAEDALEHRTHIALGKVLGAWNEREKLMALELLGEVLMGSNDAPLKRALLDTGLCQDAAMEVEDYLLQPYGMLRIVNTDAESREALLKTLRETVGGLVRDGLNRDDLSAALDRMEFRDKEGREPRGLIRNFRLLSSALHGGDPLMFLGSEQAYAFLRAQLDTRYYEELLSFWLLEEDGQALLTLLPSHTAEEEARKNEADRLHALRESWTEAELQQVMQENAALDAWQQSADTPEQLATMPVLPLSEVSPEPLPCSTEEKALPGGQTLLMHPSRQQGLAAVSLYFSVADCTEDEMIDLDILSGLMSNLPTEGHTGPELQRLLRSRVGSLNFSLTSYSRKDHPEVCQPYFIVRTKFLTQYQAEALGLVGEILTGTLLDNPALIRELLLQFDEAARQSIIGRGTTYAVTRAMAGLSAETAFQELVGGYENYRRRHALLQREDGLEQLLPSLKRLAERVFTRARLTASVTAAEALSLDPLMALLPEGAAPASREMACHLDIPALQGIVIPAPVSYSGWALTRPAEDLPAWKVASTILSLEYLWNEVRVKGGAYGAGANINSLGQASFYSYRDPTPFATRGADQGAAAFLRGFLSGRTELERYIISTISGEEPLISDTDLSPAADACWFRGITEEKRREDRRRMIAVKPADLAPVCEALTGAARFCTVGAKAALAPFEAEGMAMESI